MTPRERTKATPRPRLVYLSVFVSTLAFADPRESVLIQTRREQPPCNPCEATDASEAQLDPTTPTTTRTLENLSATIANLHVDSGGAGSFGSLLGFRGLSNTPYFSDPAITVYLDDLPLTGAFTLPTRLIGSYAGTLWRNSQATQFGRAGEAGVLVLSSDRPRAESHQNSFHAEVLDDVGNHGAESAEFNLNAATERFDTQFAAALGTRDGYIRNTLLNTHVDDQKTADVSARVRWYATDSAQFALQALATRDRDGAQPLVPLKGPLYTVSRTRDGSTDIDTRGVALKGTFATPVGMLTSTTSHTTFSLDPYDNRLVLPPPLDSRLTQTQRAWNQELKFTPTPRSVDFNWKLGFWFSDVKTRGDADRAIVNLFPIERSTFDLHSRTRALYGQASYTPTEHWQLTGGLRLERTNKDFDRTNHLTTQGIAGERTNDVLLSKLAATYAWSEQTTSSATLALASRPGGWSAYTDHANLAPFAPEHAAQLELQTQTHSRDDRWSLAARAFAYAIRDLQIERSFNAQDYLVVNAPRARSIGEELELTWHPGSSWRFTAALGATQATLQDYNDPFTHQNYDGNRVPYVPAFTANLSAHYERAGWFATAETVSTGKIDFEESQNPLFSQGAHTTVNARAGYQTDHWRITGYADNFTDEAYTTLIIPGVAHATPGIPRIFGLELAAKIG